MCGDGAFLMMHSELITSLQEGKKINVLLFDNCGFGCINNLQMGNGFGNLASEFRYRDEQGGLMGGLIPINYEGIEFVLTALFVTIFTEQWLSSKNHAPALTGLAATALCLAIFGKDVFLIPSMIVIALVLTLMRKTGKESNA